MELGWGIREVYSKFTGVASYFLESRSHEKIVLTTYSKTKVNEFLVWIMSWRVTMLLCLSSLRREASLIAVKGVPSSSWSRISFNATTCCVKLKRNIIQINIREGFEGTFCNMHLLNTYIIVCITGKSFSEALILVSLNHNMKKDCALNYKFSTCCVHKLFWMSKQKIICAHNMFWAWNFHVLNL